MTLVLNRKERKLLRRSAKTEIVITAKNYSAACNLDLLNLVEKYQRNQPDGSSVEAFRIRNRGMLYLKYLSRESRIGWVASFRYLITTAISVLALIISIVAIILQYR